MCVVSMIGDHYGRKTWPGWVEDEMDEIYKNPPPFVVPSQPDLFEELEKKRNPSRVPSAAEFEEVKKQLEEMKELLKKAVDYDKLHNQKKCEDKEKMDKLRKLAEVVGIDLDEVLKTR